MDVRKYMYIYIYIHIFIPGLVLTLTSAWLTHWGQVTHKCVGRLTTIDSDNGLSPGRRQAIIWTNAGILVIGHLGTNFSEILIEIHTFSFKKIDLKMSFGKWRPSCLGLNVLTAVRYSRVSHVWRHQREIKKAKEYHWWRHTDGLDRHPSSLKFQYDRVTLCVYDHSTRLKR